MPAIPTSDENVATTIITVSSSKSVPPPGILQYSSTAQVPPSILKYWHQRHNIFSRFDDGIWMTDDAWFGVTPEPVAFKIAQHVATAPDSKTVLIDAFAGAGGNTIAFALSGRWKQIFGVEKDPQTLACAKHNAEVYGVANKIWWIEGDIFKVLKTQLKPLAKKAVIFGSPPWGGEFLDLINRTPYTPKVLTGVVIIPSGPTYTDHEVFDLSVMQPYSFLDLYSAFNAASDHQVLYLPRTSDLRQIAKHAPDDEKLKIMHYCMFGASKALCVFFGEFQLD